MVLEVNWRPCWTSTMPFRRQYARFRTCTNLLLSINLLRHQFCVGAAATDSHAFCSSSRLPEYCESFLKLEGQRRSGFKASESAGLARPTCFAMDGGAASPSFSAVREPACAVCTSLAPNTM